MNKWIYIVGLSASLLLTFSVFAQEPGTENATGVDTLRGITSPGDVDNASLNANGGGRGPASARDVAYPAFGEERRTPINRDGHDGIRLQFYYDPLSSYSKLVTGSTGIPSQFGYANTTGGMGGVQAMWSVWAPSDLEFQTGLDYVFPVNIQDTQSSVFSNYSVQGQTLNVIGIKLVQVGYRINFGDITLTPYGGLGVYYGKSSLTLTTANSGNQTDLVNYTKLMAVYTAGMRADYSFNRRKTVQVGIGFEFFVPTKLSDQLSQSGSITSELPGQETYLQSNMDFMTGVGARLFGGVAGYF